MPLHPTAINLHHNGMNHFHESAQNFFKQHRTLIAMALLGGLPTIVLSNEVFGVTQYGHSNEWTFFRFNF